MAGRAPRASATDGPERYRIAFRVFRTLKGPIPIHIRDIHIRSPICNANRQERPNCELAGHFRYARGINKEESLIFRMAILRHNYTKPHVGTAYRMPAEAAGIRIRGAGRWLTLTQSAAAAA